IIFGSVVDDAMGEEVRVTVIAAGFERWDEAAPVREEPARRLGLDGSGEDGLAVGELGESDEGLRLGDDDFDVPSFLK
ncbi:MAG TPA: cell division protein FtsZ, partial [Acidimicrobiales bacterium]